MAYRLVFFTAALATAQQTRLRLAPEGKFAGMGLDPGCESVLYQELNCPVLVGELGTTSYHGTIGDKATTDAACAAACSTALSTARRRIVGACAKTPDLVPGYPIVALVDSIQTGWNETCQKDKETGQYCNTLIDSFKEVAELGDMAREDLCSYCFGARLRMMQSSPYSAYDELYAEMLDFVNQKCSVDSPIEILPNPININYTQDARCEPERRYKTQATDTCDSIAKKYSVSGATLYYLNPELSNCTAPSAGIELCLPDQCDTIYTVQSAEESCVEVAVDHGTSWRHIVDWNSGLDTRCSNLWSTSPFWGRTICVSAPGGEFVPPPPSNSTPGNGNTGGPGGSGDGYADTIVDPPAGVTVANGTTIRCGEYIEAVESIGCETMLARNAVPMGLFLQVNPSLGKLAIECSDKLVVGTWYCIHPHRLWNDTAVDE
ncbi:hypothetical protein FALCPG4_002161 [Fusarium falciforme]